MTQGLIQLCKGRTWLVAAIALGLVLAMAWVALPMGAQAQGLNGYEYKPPPPKPIPVEIASIQVIQPAMAFHPLAPKVVTLTRYGGDKLPKVTLFNTKAPGFLPGMMGKTVYKDAKLTLVTVPSPKGVGPAIRGIKVDFSEFSESGTYELRVDNIPVGNPVAINAYTYWDAMVPSLQSLYLMRSGSPVMLEAASIERPPSHRKDAYVETYLASGRQTLYKNVVGGWYNGGDTYAKYSPTTAFTIGAWLSAFMQSPQPWKPFKLGYGFGEPNQGDVRDILHELKHGLNWLLAMQRSDGRVYHMVDGRTLPGDIRPEDDTQPRYITGLYAQDTAMATAAFAMASVAFQQSDVGYSVKCLLAAQRGWHALQQVPSRPVAASITRRVPYVASDDTPMRLWAAMSLYYATGDKQYVDVAKALLPQFSAGPLGWENPALLIGLQHDVMNHVPVPNQILQALSSATSMRGNYMLVTTWLNSAPLQLFNAPNHSIRLQKDEPQGPNVALSRALSVLLAQPTLSESLLSVASRAVANAMGANHHRTAFVSGSDDGWVNHPGSLLGQTLRKPLPGLLVPGPLPNQPYVDGSLQPANATDLVTTARWGWILARLNWGFNQLEAEMAKQAEANR